MLLTNENEIDLEARDAAVEKVKQYYQEQYAKPYDENYIPTVDEELEEIRKKQEAEEAKRVVRLNTPHPVNVGGFVPRSMSQEERDLWDLLLGGAMYAPGEKPKSREELYKEQVEEFRKDYDAGTAESLMQGGSPEMIAYGKAARLAFEKHQALETAGSPENAYELEAASKKAFDDIMTNPELYQYTKTGDFVTDYTNALFYDEILARAIYNKTFDNDVLYEIGAQLFGEGSAAFAGASSASWTFGINPVVGTIASAAAGTETMYQYRKSKIGMGTSSINTAGRLFLAKYGMLRDLNMNKVDFDLAVRKLVDETFTPSNREYWGDLSAVIMGGEKDYLDMGPVVSTLMSAGSKIIKGTFKVGKSILKPKTKTEAIAEALSDSKELKIYKENRAEGSDQVYEGEMVSGKIVRTDTGVNEGMSKEGIIIDVNSWDEITPEGKTTHVFRDPKTGNIISWGSYKTIAHGDDAKLVPIMRKQDLMDSVAPSRGIKDIDSVSNGGNVMYIGTGADYTQPFESLKAVDKAMAEWVSKLQPNQALIPIEESTGQYYMGVVTAPDESFFNLGIKSIEKKDGATVIWHDREFDSYQEALEYRNDLREMELEGQGLTPVSAGSSKAFKEFKNNERAGWDREHVPYFGPGNYVSIDNRGTREIGISLDKDYNVTGSIREMEPDSRSFYYLESLRNGILDLLNTKKFENYIKKELPDINLERFKKEKNEIAFNLTYIFKNSGPSGLMDHLEGASEEFSTEYSKYLGELDKEQEYIERYNQLAAKYILKNKDKLSANIVSSSIRTDKIVPMGEKTGKYQELAKEHLKSKLGKDLSEFIYYDVKDDILTPVIGYDPNNQIKSLKVIMRNIIDEMISKNPVRYTGDTLKELKEKVSKNRYGADIKIDKEVLYKDLVKEYKKLLKDNNLTVLEHREGDSYNIVVSNPKELSKVNMIETITADGKHIQKAIDNGYVIRYNKETGKFEIGEVRGGEYTLEQDVGDLGIW